MNEMTAYCHPLYVRRGALRWVFMKNPGQKIMQSPENQSRLTAMSKTWKQKPNVIWLLRVCSTYLHSRPGKWDLLNKRFGFSERFWPDRRVMYWACSLAPFLLSAATSAPSWFGAAAPGTEEWRLKWQPETHLSSFRASRSSRESTFICSYLCWSLFPERAKVCGSSTGYPGTSHSGSLPDQSPAYLKENVSRTVFFFLQLLAGSDHM